MVIQFPFIFIFYLFLLLYVLIENFAFCSKNTNSKRVPFDSKTPIGYALTIFIQGIGLQHICSFFGVTAALGAGGVLFGIAIVDDMKHVLKSTNDSVILSERHITFVKFYEFIELHSIAKELSNTFTTYTNKKLFLKIKNFSLLHAFMCRKFMDISDLLEPFAAVAFASSFASICCAMLMIQMGLVSYSFRLFKN